MPNQNQTDYIHVHDLAIFGQKACHYWDTTPPGPRGSPLSSMRSKRFCAVWEQRTRNKSHRPREKWRKQKSGEGVGRKKEESFLPLPLPPLSFFGSCFIPRAVKTENLPPSFFAPEPNGNACYAGYRLWVDKACIRIVSLSVAFSDRKRTVPCDQSQNL